MGTLRCWLFRGGVLALLAALALGVVVVSDYVSPERVRGLLEAHLREKVPGAEVKVESARLRLFGGITATNVTLTRPGEAEPFFAAPSVTLAHDKEKLHGGKLVLRKIELDGPTLRVARRADGSWSLADFAPPSGDPRAPIPTVIVKNATLHVTDARPEPLPPLTLTGAKFHLLNDPAAVVRVDGAFVLAPAAPGSNLRVPMAVSFKLNRENGASQLRVEVPDLPLTADLTPALGKLSPELADALAPLTANLGVKADIRREPGQAPHYDIKVEVRDGKYADPAFPWPVDHIAGTIHYKEGRLFVERGTAHLGKARLELALETRPIAEVAVAVSEGSDFTAKLDGAVDALTLRVSELAMSDELFAKLPPKAGRVREMFRPAGTIDLNVTLTRSAAGLRQEFQVVPNRLAIAYEKFKYPVHDLRGSVKRLRTPDGADEYIVGLDGSASGRPVKLTGRVGAAGVDPLIDLSLTGIDFPIDQKLMAAMPAKYTEELARLNASGRADFTADICQMRGVDRCETSIQVRIYSGSVNAEQFPYPMTGIAGQVAIRVCASSERAQRFGPRVDTDRVDLRDFRATHGGGLVRFALTDEPVPNSPDRRRVLDVSGENLPLDADFRKSLAVLGAGPAWEALNPTGALTFAAHVEAADRAAPPVTPVSVLTANPSRVAPATQTAPPFDPTQDLSITAGFKGPSVTPHAFPYALTDVEGVLRYAGGKLEISDVGARHGASRFGVESGELRFPPAGGVWANLGHATAKPLPVTDPDLLAALPPSARAALADLKLSGPAELVCKQVVVAVPGGAGAPRGYWNAELKLAGATADAGVVWTDLHGALASVGQFGEGTVGPVVGNAYFDRVKAAGQPLTDVKIAYRVRPAGPDPDAPGGVAPVTAEFTDLAAKVFSGTVGGQARVEFAGGPPRFDLWLNASRVRLDQLAAHWNPKSGADLAGLAQGELRLSNPPDPVTGLPTLAGTGQVDVPSGRLLNLPVLVPLLKLVKLQTPDQTAFEEAHAKFSVRGDRVTVTQLDLVGNALSLGGSGELDVKAEDVRFEFYTVWSQTLRRWLQSPLGDVTGSLSENLFRIDMVKKPGGKMAYTPHVLPAVTDPVRAVAERLRDRLARDTATYRAAEAR